MSKLVLIDSMAILYRAYFALPPMKTKSGEPISAVYGLVSMLLRIIQDLKPTHIIACFDRKEPNFRVKQYKDYQSQRPPVPSDLESQFEEAKVTLRAIGIPCYEMAGFEADDIIGTIVAKATESVRVEELKSGSKKKLILSRSPALFDSVVIVTGDRDMLQLVDDEKNIKLYMPITGLSSAKMFGTRETVERMGIPPRLIPDLKGLIGDPSDNYKGVSGIGPKTAVTLLGEFGSFDGIYKNLDKVPEKTREKLFKDRESAEMSYRLAKIVTDVPVEVDFEQMRRWKIDSNNVLSLFEEYGFKTLTKRIKEVGEQITAEKQERLF